jgi:hypothetical protein
VFSLRHRVGIDGNTKPLQHSCLPPWLRAAGALTGRLRRIARLGTRELNARPAITIRVAAVEFSRHHDEAQTAEAVIIEGRLEIRGLHFDKKIAKAACNLVPLAARDFSPERRPFDLEAVNRRLAALGSVQA